METSQYDAKALRIRLKRNALLAQTDWMALSDVVMTEDQKGYRQSLRDITKQTGFPFDTKWPDKPKGYNK